MDCCICSPMAAVYRLPRNAICAPCHEGAKAIIGFLNKDDEQRQEEDGHGSVLKSRVSTMKPDSSTKGMRDAWEQVKEMRGREEEAHQRAAFLAHGLAMAWKEGAHTDIVVKPGTGPPIPAHKAILAARSEVFRHMLAGDERCKAPAGDAISLPELSHDELALFLAFLYTGARAGGRRRAGGGAAAARAPGGGGQVRRAVPAAGLRGAAGGGRGRLQRAAHAGGRGAELQRCAQGARHGHGGGARRAGGVLAGVRRVRRQERRAVRRHHPRAAAGQDEESCR